MRAGASSGFRFYRSVFNLKFTLSGINRAGLKFSGSQYMKLMQVIIFPSHYALRDSMKLWEPDVLMHKYPSPNRRIGALKRDRDLTDRQVP
jgi:hypothetical protein